MKTSIGRAVGVGVFAFASAWLGLAWFVIPPATIATIWPTGGILLAFLLLTAPDEWPLLLLSAGLATGLAQLLAGTPPLISLALTLTLLAATLFAATLVRRWAAAPLTMHRLRDVLGLVALATLASNALTALLGAAVVWASFGTPFWLAWEMATRRGYRPNPVPPARQRGHFCCEHPPPTAYVLTTNHRWRSGVKARFRVGHFSLTVSYGRRRDELEAGCCLRQAQAASALAELVEARVLVG